jgi:hypothetical protein
MMKKHKVHKGYISLWRDAAGVLVASIIALSYVAIGFADVTAQIFLATKVAFPESWLAAMLSLSSVALGFLLKTKIDQDKADTAEYDPRTNCPHCGGTVATGEPYDAFRVPPSEP